MKKRTILLFISLSGIFFLSCKDNLEPIGPFKETQILSCIVRGDTTFQTATLTTSYPVLNLDPYNNTQDTNIKGAIIRLWCGNDKVTILRDTTIQRPNNDPYKKPYSVYYSNDFKPDSNSQLEIEAILPNGKRLRAVTKTPSPVRMNEEQCDRMIPSSSNNQIHYSWFHTQLNPVYIVRLYINYYKVENGDRVLKKIIVPLKYLQNDGSYVPIFPSPINMESVYTIEKPTLDRTMQLLSDGNPDKASFEIWNCVFEVFSLDSSLSEYYNSTTRGKDSYSIKLDETDYTNIQGGLGIFGVFMRAYFVSYFKHDYIKSFGYTPGLEVGR